MTDILLIAVIIVVIIDISGFIDSLKSGLKKVLTKGRMSDPYYSLKPLDCSFCMTWWTGLIWLLVTHNVTLWMLAYLLLICVMTPVIKDVIILIRETMLKIIKLML
jgi:hypothetical protein